MPTFDFRNAVFLTAAQLAERLNVRESWVIERSKKSKSRDPMPVFKLGRHNRYVWDHPLMTAWLQRNVEVYDAAPSTAGSPRKEKRS